MIKPKRRCCLLTFVRNESFFLPLWFKYYSKYFSGKDIYVLDHSSDDGSIEFCKRRYAFNHIRLEHELWDDFWRIEQARKMQAALLRSYEYVLYADADELIVPDPQKYKDLAEYLSLVSRDCVTTTGYGLFHVMSQEHPIDLSRSILSQRSYWYPDYRYDKPVLACKEIYWHPGFHSADNSGSFRDSDLWLIHLHKIDYGHCWEKHRYLASVKWSEEVINREQAWQFRLKTEKEFKHYFERNLVSPRALQLMGRRFWLEWLMSLPDHLIFFCRIIWRRYALRRTYDSSLRYFFQYCFPLLWPVPDVLKQKDLF